MRRCSVCGIPLVPCNEGVDHISFQAFIRNQAFLLRSDQRLRKAYICQDCLHSIQNHLEYSYSCSCQEF